MQENKMVFAYARNAHYSKKTHFTHVIHVVATCVVTGQVCLTAGAWVAAVLVTMVMVTVVMMLMMVIVMAAVVTVRRVLNT